MHKKLLIFSFITIFLVQMCSLCVFAGSVSGFEITGGLVKEKESTFDEKRTIAGVAPKDTAITITVFRLVEKNAEINFETDKETEIEPPEREVLNTYSLSVGSSGLFTQTVSLELEDNYIEIKAENSSDNYIKIFLIKRKPAEIKTDLEKSIALPVETISGYLKPEQDK